MHQEVGLGFLLVLGAGIAGGIVAALAWRSARYTAVVGIAVAVLAAGVILG